jgi:hypothetical protein
MTPRPPHRTRRSKIAQNIVNNTPAGDWRRATRKEKIRLGISSKEPFYVRKCVAVRKGPFLSAATNSRRRPSAYIVASWLKPAQLRAVRHIRSMATSARPLRS